MKHAPSFLLAVALALATTASIAGIVLRDDRGVDVELPAVPLRVVSLLPSHTESLCAIGACDRLVGTDRFSNWPASVKRLPKLGGLDDAQVERIVELKPDVVLLSSSARVVDRLERLGLKVVVLESRNRADARRTLMLLARMMNRAEQADLVWATIERQTRAAADRVPPALRGRKVYVEIDPTPYAAGESSFVGETLALLGLGNAIPAELGPFPKLNPEYVVRIQPDVVVATHENLADMPHRPGWSSLRALRRRQTCGFTPALYEVLVRPGPRMGEAAGALVDCLVAMPGAR